MSLILTIDDLNPGMFVTVFAPRTERDMPRRANAHPSEPTMLMLMPVPPGIPLRILEVSMPFAACAVIEPAGVEAGPVIIDLRSITLARITPAFAQAILSFEPGIQRHRSPDDGEGSKTPAMAKRSPRSERETEGQP